MSKTRSLARLTDLYVRGKMVVVTEKEDGTPDVAIWVAAPNSFEKGEILKDAQHASLVKRLSILSDPEEIGTLQKQFDLLGREEIIDTIVSSEQNSFVIEADNDIRADETWAEALEVIDRGALIADGGTEEEKEAAEKVFVNAQEAYLKELTKRATKLAEDAVKDQEELSDEELFAKFRDAYLKARVAITYRDAQFRTKIMYALRDVIVEPTGPGKEPKYRMGSRLLEDRAQVDDLDDDLLALVLSTLNELEIDAQAVKS